MYSKLALIGAVLGGAAIVGFQASRGGFGADGTEAPPSQPTAARTNVAETPPAVDPAAALAAADAERLRLNEALSAAEAEAARLAADLAARDAAAVPAADALAQRDAEFARLEVALLEQSAEIARLTDALAQRDTEIARLLDEAKVLEASRILPVIGPARVVPAAAGTGPGTDAATTPGAEGLDEQLALAKEAPLPRPEAAAPMPLAEVHFDMGSATLSPGAEARARDAAAALAAMDLAKIRITGHSDTIGSAAANLALSRARAEAVAAILVASGLPAERIEIEAFGQDEAVLPVPTGAGVAEPLNRCVGIWPVAA